MRKEGDAQAQAEDEIEKILLCEPFTLICGLCAVIDDRTIPPKEGFTGNDLCCNILSFFMQDNTLFALLRLLIDIEVSQTKDEATLFRNNTMTTKLLTNYTLQFGLDFLRNTLRPPMERIGDMDIADYETDINRIEDEHPEEKIISNTQNLIAFCQEILDSLYAAEETFPVALRIICRTLHLRVKETFPKAQYSSLGGLIFLRFLCPAIISPDQFGIVPRPRLAKARRLLVLTSKILQNISNNFACSEKSNNAEQLNDFIHTQAPTLSQFFARLSMDHPSVSTFQLRVSESGTRRSLQKIMNYLKAYVEPLGSVMVDGQSSAAKTARDESSEKKGVMWKHGESIVGETWRKRYFVLRKGQLLYFRSVEDSHLAGAIDLSQMTLSEYDQDSLSFKLESTQRTFWLRTNDLPDLISWRSKLRPYLKKREPARAESVRMTFLQRATLMNSSSESFRGHQIRELAHLDSSASPADGNVELPAPSVEDLMEPTPPSPAPSSPHIPVHRAPTLVGVRQPNLTGGSSERSTPSSGGAISPRKRMSPSTRRHRPMTKQKSAGAATMRQFDRSSFLSLDPPKGVPSATSATLRGFTTASPTRNWGCKPSQDSSPSRTRIQAGQRTSAFFGKVAPRQTARAFDAFSERSSRVQSIRMQTVTPPSPPLSPQRPTSTPLEGSKKFSGRLQSWDAQLTKWRWSYFVISQNLLLEYPTAEDTHSIAKYLLPGAQVRVSEPSFTLWRDNTEFTFRAKSKADCQQWIEQISHATSTINTLECCVAQRRTEADPQWMTVWVELTASHVSTFLPRRDINEPSLYVQIRECIINRAVEQPQQLHLSDDKNAFTLKFHSPEEANAWASRIKATKVSSWQNVQPSSQTPHPLVSVEYERSGGTDTLQCMSDALAAGATHSGYLLVYPEGQKERRGVRQWFILRGKVLLSYANELDSRVLQTFPVTNLLIRADESMDTFEFELVVGNQSLLLEASDIADMRGWQKALHSTRIEATNAEGVGATELPQMKGMLTSFGRQEENLRFVLDGFTLSWYAATDEAQQAPIGTAGIENCVFSNFVPNSKRLSQEEQPAFQVSIPNQKDLYLIAPSLEDKVRWLKTLKQAKLQYWRSPASSTTAAFANRGFLMRVTGKKKLRRWLVINDVYLLIFKSPSDHAPETEVSLDRCKVVDKQSKESTLLIEIVSDARSFVLEACSRANKINWLKSITAIQEANRISSKHSLHDETKFLALRTPDHEGYLSKQGANVKNWKKRWFVLQYPCLFYFTSSQIMPGEHSGYIPLRDAKIVVKKQNSAIDQVVQFQIETRFRIYFLRAETEEDLDQWVKVIHSLQSSKDDNRTEVVNQSQYSARRGYLMKRGRTNKAWRRRFVTLFSDQMAYYRNEQDDAPLGVIPLENCSVNSTGESLGKENTFVVSTRFRNYFFEATDAFDMAAWMESIRYHGQPKDESDPKREKIELFNRVSHLLSEHEANAVQDEENM